MPTYQNPAPTVDVIIELADRPGTVVLIERKHTPIGWALPGGFVDRGEWVADAGVREAKEETGLDVELTELFHVYSDPARDARQHTMSTVFLARAGGALAAPAPPALLSRFLAGRGKEEGTERVRPRGGCNLRFWD